MNRTANLFQTQCRLSAAGWKPLNLDELFSWLWCLCTGLFLGKVYVTFSFCCLFSQNTPSKKENVCPENKVTVKNRIIPAHIELLFMSESRRVALEFSRARISSKELCKGNDVLLLAEVMHIFDSAQVLFCTLYWNSVSIGSVPQKCDRKCSCARRHMYLLW